MTLNSKQTHLLLDTDIGTDVDDAMTLIQLIGEDLAPKMSITTAYGDCDLRAKITRRYCNLSNVEIPIYSGEQATLSGKEVWVSGLEGSLHEGLDVETSFEDGAVDHILEVSHDETKELSILAIAPLTNIAKAVLRDPTFTSRVKHLYLMGGRFDDGKLEHNIVSDVTAAEVVFSAGFSITVVGIEATLRVRMLEPMIKRIKMAGPVGNVLSKEIYQWWDYWSESWSVPHDPIAALTFLKPELFVFSEPGEIQVVTSGLETGKTIFKHSNSGTHRMVTDFDPQMIAEEIVKSIEQLELRRMIKNAIA